MLRLKYIDYTLFDLIILINQSEFKTFVCFADLSSARSISVEISIKILPSMLHKNLEYTPAVIEDFNGRFCRTSYLQVVRDTPIAYIITIVRFLGWSCFFCFLPLWAVRIASSRHAVIPQNHAMPLAPHTTPLSFRTWYMILLNYYRKST